MLALIGGVGWLAFFWPPLGDRLFFTIAPPGLLGAFATIGWLPVVGADEPRWRAQAAGVPLPER